MRKIKNRVYFKNIEGEDWLKYEWLDISKIDEYPLLPTSIKSVLKENISISFC